MSAHIKAQKKQQNIYILLKKLCFSVFQFCMLLHSILCLLLNTTTTTDYVEKLQTKNL